MTTRRLLAALLFLLTSLPVWAQPFLLTEKSWTSTRLGLYAGLNQTFYRGDVPLYPEAGTRRLGDGSASNFSAGIVVEKAYSRLFSLSLRAGYEFMNARLAKTFTEEYRISDPQGQLSSVTREYAMDYAIHGVALEGDIKLYPVGGPGFFLVSGITLHAVTTHTRGFEGTVETPTWAAGAVQKIPSANIPDVRTLLVGVHAGLGFDIFMGKSFLSPQIQYEFPLTSVTTEDSRDEWSIDHLRLSLAFTFPL